MKRLLHGSLNLSVFDEDWTIESHRIYNDIVRDNLEKFNKKEDRVEWLYNFVLSHDKYLDKMTPGILRTVMYNLKNFSSDEKINKLIDKYKSIYKEKTNRDIE